MDSRGKFPGAGQAKNNRGTSQTSMFANDSSQNIQKTISRGPETLQRWENSSKDLGHCLGRVTKGLYRDPENSQVRVLETISEIESERDFMRLTRSDSGNASLMGPDKKHLEDLLHVHLNPKMGQINMGRIPVGVYHSGHTMDHALAPSENSNIDMGTGNELSSKVWETCRSPSQKLFLLHPDIEQVLEAHVKRLWVRHRWGLLLKVLNSINLLTLKKAPALPPPQPASPYLTSCDSRADSMAKVSNFLGDTLEKSPEEEVTGKTEITTMQSPFPASSLKSPKETSSSDNCELSETPVIAQEGSLLSQPRTCSLVGRTWHIDTVLRSGRGSPKPSLGPVTGMHEPQVRGSVLSRDSFHGVSIQERSVEPNLSRPENIRELVEDNEEPSSDWEVTLGTSVMASSQSNSVNMRSLEFLGSSKSPSLSRISNSHNPLDLCLKEQAGSANTPHGQAAAGVLQDCATSTYLQNSAPEVLLTADILASQGPQSSSQNISGSSTHISQGLCPPLSMRSYNREQQEIKTCKFQDLWYNKLFCSLEKKESCWNPIAGEQEDKLAGMKLFQASGMNSADQVREISAVGSNSSPCPPEQGQDSTERHFMNKIRTFLKSVFPNKGKEQAKSMKNIKDPSAAPKTQGSVTSKHMDSGVGEAQTLMTTIGLILEEKMRLHHKFSGSRKNLPKQESQTPLGRHSHYHRTPSFPKPSRVMSRACDPQASPKGNSNSISNRWISPCQHRPMGVVASGYHVHCPRHCLLWRGVLYDHPHHSPHINVGRKSFPQENIQSTQSKTVFSHMCASAV
jgi:hypothetical protein